MNNSISKFLVIALLLLNVNQIVKAKVVDAVSGATPVKLKIEANADKQLVLDVSYEENSVIREAPLGLNVDHRQLGKDVQLLNKEKRKIIRLFISYSKPTEAFFIWMPGYFLMVLPCVTVFR